MSTLYIVRHGDTDYNAGEGEERVRGWSDVPLDEDGKKEARRAGEKLKAKKPAGIRASDLPRARETAEIIGHIVGLEPQFDIRLRTWDVGKFTGELCDAVQPKVDAYVRKPDEPVPGNVKFKGESFEAFSERLFAGFADALEQFEDRVVIVSHHSGVSLLEAWCEEGRPADHSFNLQAYFNNEDEPGSITVFKTTVNELRGEPEPKAEKPAEKPPQKYPRIGLARVPAGVHFRCGECEYYNKPQVDGRCHNEDPELYNKEVDAVLECCDLYDHPGMKRIID